MRERAYAMKPICAVNTSGYHRVNIDWLGSLYSYSCPICVVNISLDLVYIIIYEISLNRTSNTLHGLTPSHLFYITRLADRSAYCNSKYRYKYKYSKCIQYIMNGMLFKMLWISGADTVVDRIYCVKILFAANCKINSQSIRIS